VKSAPPLVPAGKKQGRAPTLPGKYSRTVRTQVRKREKVCQKRMPYEFFKINFDDWPDSYTEIVFNKNIFSIQLYDIKYLFKFF
jgi:hypothetical protein